MMRYPSRTPFVGVMMEHASGPSISSEALDAASTALDRQLQMFATEQSGYVHRFPDGKWSVELEWICTSSLARAPVTANLANVESAAGDWVKASGQTPGTPGSRQKG